ncbi:MAG: ftsE [Alphaproteobacteria bacterium]|nr:ftsE [Alphaproteobacteria bacterium]
MIQFEKVALRYETGPEILHDLNFTLEPGSFHFLTGPSGAGKSTMLKLLYLGLRPTGGKIMMFGQDLHGLTRETILPLRRQIGVVFQDFRLLDHLSVFDNVALPLRIVGREEKELKSNVNELLKWVGLGDHVKSRPPTLSGGQKQRVAIARAIISRPRLLLADEPTGNLDDAIGMRLLHLFDELNRMGTTIVVATHNEGLVQEFGHPQLHLGQGSVSVIAGSKKAA